MFIEKRRYLRIPIKIPVEYIMFQNGYEIHAQIGCVEGLDICEIGMQVGMSPLDEQLLLHTTRLGVKFELPEIDHNIATSAQVVMIHRRSNQTGLNYIRLFFPEISNDDRECIRTYINENINMRKLKTIKPEM